MVYEVSTDDGTTWNSTTINQSSLVDETYQFRAIVTDTAGNSSTTNVINVTVDNLAPTSIMIINTEIQLDGQYGQDINPQVTPLVDGGFVVAWQGSYSSNYNDIFVQKFYSNGNIGGPEVMIDGQGLLDTQQQITPLLDGGFVVTWQGVNSSGYNDIFVQKFNSSGIPIGSEVQLDGAGHNDYIPQITALADGGFVVTWHGTVGSYNDIFVQKFTSNGIPTGSEAQLDGFGYSDESPQITATSDGGFAVTWYGANGGSTDVFVQKFDSSGNVSGSRVLLDGAGNTDYVPQITATIDGGFVVTWQGIANSGYNDIFVQKFYPNGSIGGPEILLDGQGNQDENPQITALADGGFVVIWQGTDISGYRDIFVQKSNSSGIPIGSEDRLDGQGYSDLNPQITALADGGFIVTWFGEGSSLFTNIFVQKFDSSGNISGAEVQLDGAGGSDMYPQVTAINDGGFVVTWQGYDNSGLSNIFVQKFDSEGTLVSAQSSEVGTGYLVNSNISVSDVLGITSSADNMWNSVDIISENTATAMSTVGLAAGTYNLYTVDVAGNLSDPSALSYTII